MSYCQSDHTILQSPGLYKILILDNESCICNELDELLMMHVSEPDFLRGIQILEKACGELMDVLDKACHPTFEKLVS